MSEALRFNNDKPMMSYFMRSFPKMAEAVARVKEMGAIKYDDGNWRLGNKPDDEYWNSMFRHLNYIFDGEFYDSDTGCLHIAHAVWNLCALLELNYPDLPARDEAIWADRAVHWAEEKRKREAKETGSFSEGVLVSDDKPPLRWDDMDAQTQATMIAAVQNAVDRTETSEKRKRRALDAVESLGATLTARWARGVKEKNEQEALKGTGTDEEPEENVFTKMPKFAIPDGFSPVFSQFVRKMATRDDEVRSQYAAHCEEEKRKREALEDVRCDIEWTVAIQVRDCPMCGFDLVWEGEPSDGFECSVCGEIFEVPIVPENETSEVSAFGEAGEIFGIAQPSPPDPAKHATHLAEEKWQRKTFDDLTARLKKYRERYETTESPQRNDAVDAALYAEGAVGRILKDLALVECPMCGSTAVWQGDCGRECRECGEIFEVPIVPENAVSDAAIPESAPIAEMPKFVISDADTLSFVDLLNNYFAPLGRE